MVQAPGLKFAIDARAYISVILLAFLANAILGYM